MKNLKFALKILSKTKCPLVFSIYGPIDDLSYWKECKKIVNSLPTNIKVYYRGHIKHKEVKQAITTHDALFFNSQVIWENATNRYASSFDIFPLTLDEGRI